ncbi:hypothetical protein V5E97_30860 [Singulisphaera sp. Ch08]|uniref:Uncharacterized protein n=1 Tax=Singulisphaera sp. Ch08 TaxID=3120278 RepID=A0AAU7CB46_9BACT
MIAPEPKLVAAVITEWRTNTHADVLLSRILEPEAWGHSKPFGLKLAAVYADQFPGNDLCRSYCQKHNIPIFPTVTGAIGIGTREVAVDGVIVIGEHGQYAHNRLGQTLYPRRRLFEEVVHAFRILKKRVPVFSDKHLSYDWLFARWMYDLARHEGIPFMAGSSLPVAWRLPALNVPIGSELSEALAVGYADLDAYGFHALETLQCVTERRQGGETGVLSVRCVTGPQVWEEAKAGHWSKELLDAVEPARQAAFHGPKPIQPSPNDALFLVNYRDGLKGAVTMLGAAGPCFAFSGRRRGVKEPVAAVFNLEDKRPFGHFGHLLRAIEQMIVTGRPSYPIERTLLTSGLLAALLQSRFEGGTVIPTPHLAELTYQPADWPYAPGEVGTPA